MCCVLILEALLCQVELDFPQGLSFFILVFPVFIVYLFFFHLNYSINLSSSREKCDFYCDHILLFSRSVVSNSLQPRGLQHPGFLVHQQFPGLTQIHFDRVGDAIQPSHPLSSPSSPAFSLFQHQGLFQWVSSLHQVAKILELQLQHQSFQWTFRVDFLQDWLIWSPCSPRDSQESSPAPQFESISSLVLSLLYASL